MATALPMVASLNAFPLCSPQGPLQAHCAKSGKPLPLFFTPLSASKLEHEIQKKRALTDSFFILVCGEGGIRTPGASQLNGFQDRRNRPLCHLSGHKSRTENRFDQIFSAFFSKKITNPSFSVQKKLELFGTYNFITYICVIDCNRHQIKNLFI